MVDALVNGGCSPLVLCAARAHLMPRLCVLRPCHDSGVMPHAPLMVPPFDTDASHPQPPVPPVMSSFGTAVCRPCSSSLSSWAPLAATHQHDFSGHDCSMRSHCTFCDHAWRGDHMSTFGGYTSARLSSRLDCTCAHCTTLSARPLHDIQHDRYTKQSATCTQ